MGDIDPVSLHDGHLDTITDEGWASGRASTNVTGVFASLTVSIDGEICETIIADQYRKDLLSADLPNKTSAFWYLIPEKYKDGNEHTLSVYNGTEDHHIRNSPQKFCIKDLIPAVNRSIANYIPNADFKQWKNGVYRQINERFDEICDGWYFDFKKGTNPDVTISVANISGLAFKEGEYALRIAVNGGGEEGYMRLVIPLNISYDKIQDGKFSIGVKRPLHAPANSLHIQEIFLGSLSKTSLSKINSIKKRISPLGTQVISNIPVVPKKGDYQQDEKEKIAISIDIKGNGEITIYSPVVSTVSLPDNDNFNSNGFECPRIQDQVEYLELSDIWRSEYIAVAKNIGSEPIVITPKETGVIFTGIPFVQIVIPVFNACMDVEECIRSIIDSTHSPFEIILSDDGSGEYTEQRIKNWINLDPRVKYFRHKENVGYTRNINSAIQKCVAEFIVLLNSDTIVTNGWIDKLYEGMQTADNVAAVGPLSNAASWQSIPKTKAANGDWMVNLFPAEITPSVIAGYLDQLSSREYPEFPLLNGFCTMFRKSALEEVAYFDDEAFPQGYGEENDLCLRLGNAGYTLRVAESAFVYHKKSKSFGNERRKELSKAANAILKSKHPETDFVKIEELMRTNPAVNNMRDKLSKIISVEIN